MNCTTSFLRPGVQRMRRSYHVHQETHNTSRGCSCLHQPGPYLLPGDIESARLLIVAKRDVGQTMYNLFLTTWVRVSVFLGTVLLATAAWSQKLPATWGKKLPATWGNLSTGKFYVLNPQPSVNYSDRWPVTISGRRRSDGAKLTDEVAGSQWPLTEWVGWYDTQVEITLDLGNVQSISDINVRAASRGAWDIAFPSSACFATSTDGSNWQSYSVCTAFPSDPPDGAWKTAQVSGSGWVNSRYVKVTLERTQRWAFIDEIWVNGSIVHTRKHIPTDGKVMHGAFPVDESGNMQVTNFEAAAKRRINIILWYSDQQLPFASYITENVINQLGNRNLQLAWLPDCKTSNEIASGQLDDYANQFFIDMKSFITSHRTQFPTFGLWFRPMNEMNGAWTFPNTPCTHDNALKYGGNPISFRWAWRRLYNIAESTGAIDNDLIFLWSAEAREPKTLEPSKEYLMENYYPGHQYVDWVGVSAYGDSSPTDGCVLPVDSLLSKLDWLYGETKPLMISEGGCGVKHQDPDTKALWIRDWFFIPEVMRENFRAAVWFNKGDRRMEISPRTLEAYQPYFRWQK
jgi:F5/8 type C domain/Glycosyl hydrolase family 26